jgi:hypothetical protein
LVGSIPGILDCSAGKTGQNAGLIYAFWSELRISGEKKTEILVQNADIYI